MADERSATATTTPVPRDSDPADTWALSYEGFDPAREGLREALCTLGNGYFATRGAAAEARADDVHYPGTYVAGLYNRLGTELQGRVVENEDVVNVPNWLPLTFRAVGARTDEGDGAAADTAAGDARDDGDDGPWFAGPGGDAPGEVLSVRQELDLRAGALRRVLRWRDPAGRVTLVTQWRLVSMDDPHAAAMAVTFEAENWAGRIEVRSGIDAGVVNRGVKRYRDLNGWHLSLLETGEALAPDEPGAVGMRTPETVHALVETVQSKVRIAVAVRTRVTAGSESSAAAGASDAPRVLEREGGYVGHRFAVGMAPGRPVTVEKVAALFTGKDRAITEPLLEARVRVARAGDFDTLFAGHSAAWDRLWHRLDVSLNSAVTGNARAELILRLHVFHLLQTVSRHSTDLDVGVPARGLHGEAYRGHIFWDELFIFPFLNYRLPSLTRALLAYRHRRLDEARELARAEGLRGAMYPWQSGSNGREETQVLHLNPKSGRWLPDVSHRQRHVNAAIAYNAWQYYQITEDHEFLRFGGAEMLVEIARFWSSLATFDEARGRYVIRGVMGPDEYHEGYPDAEPPAGLDNNAYTNVMAVWVLLRAEEALDRLPPYHRDELVERLDLDDAELERWDDVTRRMFVPFHDDGVISQFEGYDDLEEFDWDGYRAKYGDIQRLDRILEAEGDSTNRYKLSKQADVMMLFYLLSADELRGLLERLGYELPPEAIPRTVEYYLRRTSHGSTLSGVVHSWVLARSNRERAWEFLERALESDIGDVQGGTTAEGIHLGAMAGTVDLVERGLTGMEARGDVLWFSPALPPELPELRLGVYYRGNRLSVVITAKTLTVTPQPSPHAPVRIGLKGKVVEVAPGTTLELAL